MGMNPFSNEGPTLSAEDCEPGCLHGPEAGAAAQGFLKTGPPDDVSSLHVHLSVVIPVFNEGARIVSTILRLCAYLDTQDKRFEIIISDDGSNDQSPRLVRQIIDVNDNVRLIRDPQNRGKGAAVRRGIIAARGELVLFMDADLSYPLETIGLCLDALQNHDIAIGSRNLPDSEIQIRPTLPRRLTGPLFKTAVGMLVISGYSDTQCGFKGFRADAAAHIFSNCTTNGFAFDVEVLALARDFGYSITELPVRLIVDSSDSKINLTTDPLKMIGELLRIRRKMRRTGKPRPRRLILSGQQNEEQILSKVQG
ncbi:MAG: dolichyl-phosphate beta-glucosyltransferase [Thermoleophilia bacterium]